MSMGRQLGTYHPMHRSQRGLNAPLLFGAQNGTAAYWYLLLSYQPAAYKA